jgi:N-acetylated-alpha-linked acidic dipeptidase
MDHPRQSPGCLVNGADDPISGQSALLEEAQSIGDLLKTGWRPQRTLVYCAWDGEEPGLLGSTEWVEAHEKELQQKAVVYINSDDYARGFLFAEGSHSLEPFMDEIAKTVRDPEEKVSVFQRWKDHALITAGSLEAKETIMAQNSLKLGAMGSGSDYSSFLQHAGIPSLNLGFGGEGNDGQYHSIYDSYYDFTKFKDPGFHYGIALAQTAGHAVLRMADADVLPFDFTHLYRTIQGYAGELMTLLKNSRKSTEMENELIRSGAYAIGEDPTKDYRVPGEKPVVPYLDFAPLQNALAQLKLSTDRLSLVFAQKVDSGALKDAFNQGLYRAEQQLLNLEGLPGRPWYRHTIYAPGFYTGYGVKTLPGIREAIEQGRWKEAQDQIEVDANAIKRLSDYFKVMTD